MSWALDHLGLGPDAGERDVKRAYARLLKETRPAEDPKGFQRLREAYEAALAQVAWRERMAAEEGEPAAAPEPAMAEPQTWAPSPAPVAAQREPEAQPPADVVPAALPDEPVPEGTRVTMTPDQIALMLLEQAAALPGPDAVRQWLADQPFLWDLNLKHAVADVLPWVLNGYEGPLFVDNLDVLWAFFDLDQVTDGAHVERTYAYQHKRHELSLRWLVVDDNRRAVTRPDVQQRLEAAWAPGFAGKSYASVKLARHLGWVSQPAAFWLNVWRAMWWGRAGHMARLLAWLSQDWTFALVPPLDRGQLRFWLRACDASVFSQERVALVFAQYVSVILAVFLPFGLIPLVAGTMSSEVRSNWAGLVMWGALIPVYRSLWVPLVAWQSLPEGSVARHAWPHTLCVPLFIGAGVLLLALGLQVQSVLVWIWAGWLIYYRFRGRQGLKWDINLGGWLWYGVLLVVLFGGAGLLVPVLVGLMAAGYWFPAALLALWGWELHKSRPLALERRGQVV